MPPVGQRDINEIAPHEPPKTDVTSATMHSTAIREHCPPKGLPRNAKLLNDYRNQRVVEAYIPKAPPRVAAPDTSRQCPSPGQCPIARMDADFGGRRGGRAGHPLGTKPMPRRGSTPGLPTTRRHREPVGRLSDGAVAEDRWRAHQECQTVLRHRTAVRIAQAFPASPMRIAPRVPENASIRASVPTIPERLASITRTAAMLRRPA